MKADGVNQVIEEITDKAEELNRRLNEVAQDLEVAEKEAFERGVAAGLAAREADVFENKTIIVKVPQEFIESTLNAFVRLQRKFNCKIVACSEYVEIKDLHELDLKALGLKRIDD